MAKVPASLPLEPGEAVQDAWVAAVPFRGGRAAKWGGALVLTDRRLIFEPLKVPVVANDVPFGSMGPEHRATAALADLAGAEAAPAGRRALLRLHTRAGDQIEFLISASRMAPLWSKKNRPACEAAAGAITAAARPPGAA